MRETPEPIIVICLPRGKKRKKKKRKKLSGCHKFAHILHHCNKERTN